MRLYFVRHGTAVPVEEWSGNDETRPLTKGGKAQIERVADTLAALEVTVDQLITSKLTRAAETADILAAKLHLKGKLHADERVGPGFDAHSLTEIFADFPGTQTLMLVGHEPDFSRTIGELTGGRVTVKKGGLAMVELADQNTMTGELIWLVPPKLLGK